MHIKTHLDNWSSRSIHAYLLLIIFSCYSLAPNPHMIARAQTVVSDIVEDSCEITDSSAYLWGVVYYRSTAIQGVDISLNVNGETVETVTRPGDSLPTYCISSTAIGEVAEITAKFAGQRVTRSVRIFPGEDLKQQVNLVIPKRSIWNLWRVNIGINILKVAQDRQFMIAGSQTGVVWLPKDTMRGLSSKSSLGTINATYINMPGLDKAVRDIAVHNNGQVWAITDEGLFRQPNAEENSWVKQIIPITGTLNALTINLSNGTVWVGGGESQREIAVYLDEEWSHIYTTGGDIRELTVDSQGNLWVGTWGSGVYKHNSQEEWIHYQFDDGLVSNYIHTIMAMTQRGGVEILWFGAGYEADGEGAQGGVGYHNSSNNEWRIYGIEHGLPENLEIEGLAADVFVFTVDEEDVVWAGTNQGLYLLGNDTPGHERWILHDEEINGPVHALAAFNQTIVVATETGLKRLADNPELPTPEPILLQSAEIYDDLLHLQVDSTNILDESTNVVWVWASNHNGPLCTTPKMCLFPTDRLKIGRHEIELRVQNDIGGWFISKKLRVTIGHEVYLPTIRNGRKLSVFLH